MTNGQRANVGQMIGGWEIGGQHCPRPIGSSSSANRHLSVDQLGPHRPSAAAGLHQLLARAQWIVPPRDFHSEVRGPLDVEHLLGNCAVLLDLTEMELEDIVMR